MASPYVGEIRMFAGNFAPAGWMFCEGQTLPISEYETLYNLIGTTYGGDGQETFQLPDLQGRLPVHAGSGFVLAEKAGVESVTLTVQQIPAHSHPMLGTNDAATDTAPAALVPAKALVNVSGYGADNPTTALHPSSVTPSGGNQPHDNFQPYLCVNFIISMFGIFPHT
jgi:microcystin-dependent protein